MSDQKNPDIRSIFEEPASDALRIDEANRPTEIEQGDRHLKASIPLGGVDPFDHSAEQQAIRDKQKEDGVAPPPMPVDEGTPPVRNPGVMASATDQVKDEMERRFRLEVGDLNIQVTASDRDAFVRAALHDSELRFDIALEGIAATVVVAIPSEEFTTSAAAAVNAWGQEGRISKDSDLQWLLAFQQIHAWFSVRSINGIATAWSDFWTDTSPSLKQIREFMRNYDNFEPFFRMHAVRWRMLMDAIRIAEHKYKVCLQNWKNRSFFTGAATE